MAQIMRERKNDLVRGREGEKPRGQESLLQLQPFIRQQDFLAGRHINITITVTYVDNAN